MACVDGNNVMTITVGSHVLPTGNVKVRNRLRYDATVTFVSEDKTWCELSTGLPVRTKDVFNADADDELERAVITRKLSARLMRYKDRVA
jgi:hypothetical protein